MGSAAYTACCVACAGHQSWADTWGMDLTHPVPVSSLGSQWCPAPTHHSSHKQNDYH